MQTYVPPAGGPSGQGRAGRKIFRRERFAYDAALDSYRCPGGQTLERAYQDTQAKGKNKDRIIYYNLAACRACPLRPQCTSAKHRVIARRHNENVIEEQARRLKAKPEMMARRRELVEHVFGTLRNWGYDRFLMKGLEKVRAELDLSGLAYNLRRAINHLGVAGLLKGLSQPHSAN